ncbi:polysaccharide biosynthesis/export family protein [Flavobacterium sp. YJ01]|uniref:polysaccharide biosynthesis/export family protein n=1 Tax=unclassified Flavobacterium TaxID=196869 RepID=UPI0023E3D2EE|nr:polysaccharide biosynthesis/export family protein [Flavobacterium sp. YJ01]WET04102.1 polysaccharide biosynthesis/export family protein [Flavobacterium sp. YJ01]
MNRLLYIILSSILFFSCASRKDIIYFQDAGNYTSVATNLKPVTIEPNDILSIRIGALVPETALAYNIQTPSTVGVSSTLDILKVQGYLVSPDKTIVLPILGEINTAGLSVKDLETKLKSELEKGAHLVNPSVAVRILNAKVTVLGEVKSPGTYSFLEQSISIPQALGYAGDLTINGKRNDILLIRESEGKRTITHVDLTTAEWMNKDQYQVHQNDILVVNPNDAKVKTAGYIGNASTILTIASLILSSIILITR